MTIFLPFSDQVSIPAKFSIEESSDTSMSLISKLAHDFAELSAAKFDDDLATLYVTSEERDYPISNCAVVKLQENVSVCFASSQNTSRS